MRKHQNETCSKCYTKHFHIKDQIFQVFYYQGFFVFCFFLNVIRFYLDTHQKCCKHSDTVVSPHSKKVGGSNPRWSLHFLLVPVCLFTGHSGFPSQTSKNMYKINIQSETLSKWSDEALDPILLYIYIMYM